MSQIVCEKPVPHRHEWPTRRYSDGLEPIKGDLAQCDCGKYALRKRSDYGLWWCTITDLRARWIIKRCNK